MAKRTLSRDDVATLARFYEVPPSLALAVYKQESGEGTNTTTSPKGAVGGFQIKPSTFREMYPEGDINDPVDNAIGGIKYLAYGLKKSGGDPEGAAHVYYSGRVLKPGEEGPTSGPGTPTVRGYGKNVVSNMQRIEKELALNKPTTPAEPEVKDDLFGAAPTTEGNPLETLGPFFNTASAEGGPPEEELPPPDIAGLTRPLDVSRNGEWMGPQDEHMYALDKYVRDLVNQELSGA